MQRLVHFQGLADASQPFITDSAVTQIHCCHRRICSQSLRQQLGAGIAYAFVPTKIEEGQLASFVQCLGYRRAVLLLEMPVRQVELLLLANMMRYLSSSHALRPATVAVGCGHSCSSRWSRHMSKQRVCRQRFPREHDDKKAEPTDMELSLLSRGQPLYHSSSFC